MLVYLPDRLHAKMKTALFSLLETVKNMCSSTKKYVNIHTQTNRPTGNEFSILYFAYCMIKKTKQIRWATPCRKKNQDAQLLIIMTAIQVGGQLLRRPTYTLTTWHCPHSPAATAAIDRYLLVLPAGPTAANPPHAAAAGEWDRQTDGRTPYRFIDPAPHSLCEQCQ